MWIIYNVQNVWTPYNSLFFPPHSYKLPIFLSTEYTPFLPLKLIHSFSPQNFILVHSLSSSQLHTHTHPGFFSSSYTPRLPLNFIQPLSSSQLHSFPIFLFISYNPYLPINFIHYILPFQLHTLPIYFTPSPLPNFEHSMSSSLLHIVLHPCFLLN